MNKTFIFAILITISLSSCQTAAEREKIYRADYYNYSCPQLYQKYVFIKQRYMEERTTRLAINAASSMIEILDPANPRGSHRNHSSKEYDYEIQMKAIENLAIDKKCEGVKFY